MLHPADWVFVTCCGFDPSATDLTILTTSSKSGKELVLSLEWINSPSTVTSNEAGKLWKNQVSKKVKPKL